MPTPPLLSNAKPKRPRYHPKNEVIGGRNGRIRGQLEGPAIGESSACYRCRSSAPHVVSWLVLSIAAVVVACMYMYGYRISFTAVAAVRRQQRG